MASIQNVIDNLSEIHQAILSVDTNGSELSLQAKFDCLEKADEGVEALEDFLESLLWLPLGFGIEETDYDLFVGLVEEKLVEQKLIYISRD